MRSFRLAAATAAFLLPASAFAHLGLDAPVSRAGQNVLKFGPCGAMNSARSANVTTLSAGQQVMVVWRETVNHPGHYRIAFDNDGDNDFADPPCLTNCNAGDPMPPTFQLNGNSTILLDNIADGTTSAMITLPNIECSNCTLQVIQVMYDKRPYTIPGDDIYYQCADLVLTMGPIPDAGVVPDSGVRDGGSGSNPDATATTSPDATSGAPDAAPAGGGGDAGVSGGGNPDASQGEDGKGITSGCSASSAQSHTEPYELGLLAGALALALFRRSRPRD